MEAWGEVEAEPEVREWLLSLSDDDFGAAMFYIDLLGAQGVLPDRPYTPQLAGQLRELRFYIGRDPMRIAYYVASGRRIILLTVFPKTQRRDRAEIMRAQLAMERCIAEGHTADDDEEA